MGTVVHDHLAHPNTLNLISDLSNASCVIIIPTFWNILVILQLLVHF